MFKRVSFFVYGVVGLPDLPGTFLYAIGFVGNFGVPTALDGPATGPSAARSPSTRACWRSSPSSTA